MNTKLQKESILLGEIFLRVRKERNVSLQEVENVLSIKTTYLMAIEEGRIILIISPVYARGFIKQYASFFDIDGEKLLKQYPNLCKFFYQTQDYNTSKNAFDLFYLETRSSPEREIKCFPNIVKVVLIFLGIGGLLFILKLLKIL